MPRFFVYITQRWRVARYGAAACGALRAHGDAQERIVTEPKMPLDILITVMRDRYEHADIEGAVAIAKAVAPFVHAKPRPRAGAAALGMMRDEQLAELCRPRTARAGASEEDPA
jgi:hypothetical protein